MYLHICKCTHIIIILVSVAVEDLKEMLGREQEEEQSWSNELQAIVGAYVYVRVCVLNI